MFHKNRLQFNTVVLVEIFNYLIVKKIKKNRNPLRKNVNNFLKREREGQ